MRIIKPLPKKRSWDLAVKKDQFGEIQKVALADAPYKDEHGNAIVKVPRDRVNYWSRDTYFTYREKATEGGYEIVKPFIFEGIIRPTTMWRKGSCFEEMGLRTTLLMKEGDVHQLVKQLVLGQARLVEGAIVGKFTWVKFGDELTITPYAD